MLTDAARTWAEDLLGARVARVAALSGGVASRMLLLSTERDEAALRQQEAHPWRRHAPALLTRERDVQTLLAGTGVPAQRTLGLDATGELTGDPGLLMTRLPEEMDRVDDDTDRGRLVARTRGTPVEHCSAEVFEEIPESELRGVLEVAGLQKWNLVLVLLVSQFVQVLLLSVAVLVFFLVFGSVVMQPEVVGSWLGAGGPTDVTGPLVKVSVFLAGFSGLYFTVYAVTDETYRQQFFTSVTRELERAVAVRAVYGTLHR